MSKGTPTAGANRARHNWMRGLWAGLCRHLCRDWELAMTRPWPWELKQLPVCYPAHFSPGDLVTSGDKSRRVWVPMTLLDAADLDKWVNKGT
jgi:hypothetical protein